MESTEKTLDAILEILTKQNEVKVWDWVKPVITGVLVAVILGALAWFNGVGAANISLQKEINDISTKQSTTISDMNFNFQSIKHKLHIELKEIK